MTIGVRDAVTGTAGFDQVLIEADGTWAGSTAVNAYTGERVSVAGKLRSYDTYDTYDLGAGANDTLNGTDGGDALFFTTAGSARLDANGTSVAAIAHFIRVERFVMGAGADVLDLTAGAGGAASYAGATEIIGDTDAFRSSGTAAGDVLWGGGGGEIIYGDDVGLTGAATGGADRLDGGGGSDTLYGDAVQLRVSATGGGDTLRGGAGGDQLFGDAFTIIATTVGGADVLEGGAGDDRLFGDADQLSASSTGGADVLEGGAGNDTLYGDARTFSSFTGTRGADDFVFRADSGLDTVGDFQVGVDDILVSTAAYGHDSFSDLTITNSADGAVVALDGAADTITFTGVTAASLTAADFQFIA